MLDYSPYLGRYVVIKPSKVSVQKFLEVTSMHHVHKTVQVIPIAMEMKNVALMVIILWTLSSQQNARTKPLFISY